MAMVAHTRSSACFVWEISQTALPARSPVFTLWERQWCFDTETSGGEFYGVVHAFVLKQMQPDGRFHEFQVTVYLCPVGETRLEYYDEKSISFKENSSCCVFKLQSEEDRFSRLVFQFDDHISAFPDAESEQGADCQLNWSLFARDKCVQTPPYLDREPCLKALSTDLKKLLDQSAHSDIHLRCGDVTIPAHLNVLRTRLERFRGVVAIYGGPVKIEGMEFPTLREFLGYLYSGTLPELTVELASRLYRAADKYAVETLKERCADFLKESVTHRNACGLLALADAHKDEELKEFATRYIMDEGIIHEENEWLLFSNDNPDLAHEVLYRAFKALSPK